MSGTNDPPGYRPPAKPPTDAIHRTDPPKPARPLPPARPAATPAPVPAPAQQQEPKKREISVFAAPPPEPMSANKKLAIVGAVVFALYVVYWMSTAFTGMTFKDRLSTIPVEAYGQDAKFIAEVIVNEGKKRGVKVRLDEVQVNVGPDTALGRMVKMDVRWRRFLLPSKKIHQEVRCPNPLVPGTWDGKKLMDGPA